MSFFQVALMYFIIPHPVGKWSRYRMPNLRPLFVLIQTADGVSYSAEL